MERDRAGQRQFAATELSAGFALAVQEFFGGREYIKDVCRRFASVWLYAACKPAGLVQKIRAA
jgi:dienelactone hydrolase